MSSSRRADAAIVCLMLATAAVTLSLGYRQSRLTFVVISAIVLVARVRWAGRPELVLGLVGLSGGPLAELCATNAGLWRYAVPDFAGLPCWTLPMWWMFPIAVARLSGALTPPKIAAGSPIESGAFAAASVAWLCAFGVARPLLAFAGTLALLALWLARHWRPEHVVALLLCGLIGPVVELVPVGLGAWSYPSTPLFGLPLWLPTGYGVFGAALVELGRALGESNAERAEAVAR